MRSAPSFPSNEHVAVGARICLEGVSVRVGAKRVLSNMSLDSDARRIGVVGRNGSGKTTLARVLAGLIRPDTGRVLIDGVDVFRDRRVAIRTVGILFQNPDHQIIFPTVQEELAFGLRQLGQDKATARDNAGVMLARFGKAHWATSAIATLSQGQRHLVCMMAVLAMEPALIILDEPFTGLDIPTTRLLHRTLSQVTPSVLQVTHDLAALTSYDRVIWLEHGHIHYDGSADECIARYTSAMEGDEYAGANFLD